MGSVRSVYSVLGTKLRAEPWYDPPSIVFSAYPAGRGLQVKLGRALASTPYSAWSGSYVGLGY